VPSEEIRVFVVDDDEQQLDLLDRGLRAFGFEVRTSSSPIGVTNAVREFKPHVVLLDVNIPALSGDKLVTLLRRSLDTEGQLILFSSSDQDRLRRLAREVSADGWIQKGLATADLAKRIRSLTRD